MEVLTIQLSVREQTCPVRCGTRRDLRLTVEMAHPVRVDDQRAAAECGAEAAGEPVVHRYGFRYDRIIEHVALPFLPWLGAVLRAPPGHFCVLIRDEVPHVRLYLAIEAQYVIDVVVGIHVGDKEVRHGIAQRRIESAPLACSGFGNRPVAVLDGKHVGDAVTGEIPKPQLIHRERRALHWLPVWMRQGRHEPLTVGPAPKCVGGLSCDTRPMVPNAGVEASELNLRQGHAERAKRLPVSGAAARDHPLPVMIRKHVASQVVVEIAEPQVLQALRLGVEIGPMKLAEAREPPRRACREEQIIHAIAIKIAHTVTAEGVDVVHVARSDGDVVRRVKVDRVVLARERKDVVVDVCADRGPASDVDVVFLPVLPCVREHPELDAGVSAQVATPPASRTVRVEAVRIGIEERTVVAAAFEH